MSGKNKYQHEEQVFRYLRNEMTEQERNAFEREMQKDPFLAEAVDGLSRVSADSCEEDILLLKKNLKKGEGRKRMLWWSAAAASLLIMVVSTFMLVDLTDKTNQFISESSPVETDTSNLKAPEQLPVQPMPEKMEEQKKEVAETEVVENKLELMDVEDDVQVETEQKSKSFNIPEVKDLSKDKSNQVEKMLHTSRVADDNEILMMVGNEEVEDTSVPRVIATQEKALAFAKAVEEADSSIDEVVVVGYGTSKKMDVTGAVSTTPVSQKNRLNDREAQPTIGWKEYYAYLDSACSNTEMGLPDEKVVVKLSLVVTKNGKAGQFKILRSTSEAYNPEAIRIIQSGANWLPKLEDSRPAPEKLTLRLVFKPGTDTND